jgi:hypothetical protein
MNLPVDLVGRIQSLSRQMETADIAAEKIEAADALLCCIEAVWDELLHRRLDRLEARMAARGLVG